MRECLYVALKFVCFTRLFDKGLIFLKGSLRITKTYQDKCCFFVLEVCFRLTTCL